MSEKNSQSSRPETNGLILSNESVMVTNQNDHRSSMVRLEAAQADQPSRQKGLWRGALTPMLVAALVAALVTGAAVGGGVGGWIARRKSEPSRDPSVNTSALSSGLSSSPTTSLATTAGGLFVGYAPEPTGAVATLYDNCTLLTRSPQITLFDDKFSVYCGIDINAGRNAVETDASGETLVIADIAPIIAYTPQDCLQACSSFTKMATRWDRTEICRSVAFSYDMSSAISANGANCWLKNGTIAAPSKAEGCNDCLSAMLA